MTQKIQSRHAFTLTELLLVIVILGIAAIPMIEAFVPARRMATLAEDTTAQSFACAGILNQIDDLTYAELTTYMTQQPQLLPDLATRNGTSTTSVVCRGISYIPTVTLTDASGGDGGLIQIDVSVDNITMSSLKAEY